MTLAKANRILLDPNNRCEMTGVEEALLTVLIDLQERVASLALRLSEIDKGATR